VWWEALIVGKWWETPHSFNRLLIQGDQTKQKEIKRSGGGIPTLQM